MLYRFLVYKYKIVSIEIQLTTVRFNNDLITIHFYSMVVHNQFTIARTDNVHPGIKLSTAIFRNRLLTFIHADFIYRFRRVIRPINTDRTACA